MVKTCSLPDAVYQEGKVYQLGDDKLVSELLADNACTVLKGFTPPKSPKKRDKLMPSSVPDPLSEKMKKPIPTNTVIEDEDVDEDEDNFDDDEDK